MIEPNEVGQTGISKTSSKTCVQTWRCCNIQSNPIETNQAMTSSLEHLYQISLVGSLSEHASMAGAKGTHSVGAGVCFQHGSDTQDTSRKPIHLLRKWFFCASWWSLILGSSPIWKCRLSLQDMIRLRKTPTFTQTLDELLILWVTFCTLNDYQH